MRYSELLKKIEQYKIKYRVSIIGKTMLGRNIYAVEKVVNENFFTAIFVASVHAREYISTELLCRFLDDGLFDEITRFNVSCILMANPDGVELCYDGERSVKDENLKRQLIKINNYSKDFSLWKANAAGVDVNNNFDANFGQNTSRSFPSTQGYVGLFAESEKETQALVEFTQSKKVFLTISYHRKGEEIYYNFFQTKNNLERDFLIADRFAKSTGYQIKNVESVSSGGYKDWCVQKLKIPALTIEIGSDNLSHPISKNHLEEIYAKHKSVANDLNFAYNVFSVYKNLR